MTGWKMTGWEMTLVENDLEPFSLPWRVVKPFRSREAYPILNFKYWARSLIWFDLVSMVFMYYWKLDIWYQRYLCIIGSFILSINGICVLLEVLYLVSMVFVYYWKLDTWYQWYLCIIGILIFGINGICV